MQQLLSALAALHELGIVHRHAAGTQPSPVASSSAAGHLSHTHAERCRVTARARRDIKPENLMVSGLEDPNALRLTLIDFGYADVKSGGENLERLAGSPEYAAPEVRCRRTSR
eukprot:5734952-Prymnesium_polylepis.1